MWCHKSRSARHASERDYYDARDIYSYDIFQPPTPFQLVCSPPLARKLKVAFPLLSGLIRHFYMATYKILVGSCTDSIYTLEFDPAPSDGTPPTLRLLSQVNVGHHPSWIEAHPSDRSLIFTGLEQTDGQIVVVKYDKDGKGQKIDEATCASGGAEPCTLLATEHELVVGNVSPLLPRFGIDRRFSKVSSLCCCGCCYSNAIEILWLVVDD